MFPCNDLVAEELLLQAIGWEDAGLSDSLSIAPSVCLPSTVRGDNQAQDSADTAFFYNMHTGQTVKTLENIVNIKLRKQRPRYMGPNTRSINNDPVCPTPHAAWAALKMMVGGGFGTELMLTSHFTQVLVETSDAVDETDGDLSMIEELARLREEAAMLLGHEITDADLDKFSSDSEDPDVQISITENDEDGESSSEFDILSPSLLGDVDEPIKHEIEGANRELLSFFALTPKEIADKMSMLTPSHVHLSGTDNGWWEYGPDDDRSNPSLECLYRLVDTWRELFCVTF